MPSSSMPGFRCRACASPSGEVVLDLGSQPPWDHLPRAEDPLPDPSYRLRMWWCRDCWLAQLVEDAEDVVEVPIVEPRAMLEQTDLSIARMDQLGLLVPGATVTEFGSPHGQAWLPRLLDRGMVAAEPGERAALVLDVYGLLHDADQAAALRRRAAALAPGGTLVVQMLSLATVLRHGQWFDLRHGHYGYWSLPALQRALRRHRLGLHRAWSYPLGGGTVLATITATPRPDAATAALLAAETGCGVGDPQRLRTLQSRAESLEGLRRWLADERAAGRTVLGYGAASRAVPLICRAGLDSNLLPAIADASRAKQGRRMPGTDIPIVSPEELLARRPDRVLLLLPLLADEVRAALPGVEATGGRWVMLDCDAHVQDVPVAV